MNTDIPHRIETHEAVASSESGRRIDSAAWAAFFIWVGTSILADVGWGWFLAGVGTIVLAAQASLKLSGEKVDVLWLVCGAVFLAAGVWEIFGLRWPLAPLLMILLGIGLLWKTFFRKPTKSRPSAST